MVKENGKSRNLCYGYEFAPISMNHNTTDLTQLLLLLSNNWIQKYSGFLIKYYSQYAIAKLQIKNSLVLSWKWNRETGKKRFAYLLTFGLCYGNQREPTGTKEYRRMRSLMNDLCNHLWYMRHLPPLERIPSIWAIRRRRNWHNSQRPLTKDTISPLMHKLLLFHFQFGNSGKQIYTKENEWKHLTEIKWGRVEMWMFVSRVSARAVARTCWNHTAGNSKKLHFLKPKWILKKVKRFQNILYLFIFISGYVKRGKMNWRECIFRPTYWLSERRNEWNWFPCHSYYHPDCGRHRGTHLGGWESACSPLNVPPSTEPASASTSVIQQFTSFFSKHNRWKSLINFFSFLWKFQVYTYIYTLTHFHYFWNLLCFLFFFFCFPSEGSQLNNQHVLLNNICEFNEFQGKAVYTLEAFVSISSSNPSEEASLAYHLTHLQGKQQFWTWYRIRFSISTGSHICLAFSWVMSQKT